MNLSDVKKLQAHEILAYVVVGLSPLIVGVIGSLLFYPQLVESYDYKKLLMLAFILPLVAELIFVGIAIGAMYDELDIAIRARAAVLSGSVFFLASAIIGLWSAWYTNQRTALVTCLVIGWIVLGLTVRRDTRDLEAELEAWEAGRKPTKRSSHFYWTRREEVFKALRPVDWESRPPRQK